MKTKHNTHEVKPPMINQCVRVLRILITTGKILTFPNYNVRIYNLL
jgi:hypothetical protein